MKFLADENIPIKAVQILRQNGIDIISTLDLSKGLKDLEIADSAKRSDRIIITFDKEFGGLVFRKRVGVSGIILLRIIPSSAEGIATKILGLVKGGIPLAGRFVVVEEERVRFRDIK